MGIPFLLCEVLATTGCDICTITGSASSHTAMKPRHNPLHPPFCAVLLARPLLAERLTGPHPFCGRLLIHVFTALQPLSPTPRISLFFCVCLSFLPPLPLSLPPSLPPFPSVLPLSFPSHSRPLKMVDAQSAPPRSLSIPSLRPISCFSQWRKERTREMEGTTLGTKKNSSDSNDSYP